MQNKIWQSSPFGKWLLLHWAAKLHKISGIANGNMHYFFI